MAKKQYLENRKCLNCPKKFVAKIYMAQKGLLKGEWIISSVYCSTKCYNQFMEKLNGKN